MTEFETVALMHAFFKKTAQMFIVPLMRSVSKAYSDYLNGGYQMHYAWHGLASSQSPSFIPSLFTGQPAPSLSRAQFPVNACRLPGLSCCQLSAISLLERIAIKTSLFLRSWKKTDSPYTNHQTLAPICGKGGGVAAWRKCLKINIRLQKCYDFANCQERRVICMWP